MKGIEAYFYNIYKADEKCCLSCGFYFGDYSVGALTHFSCDHQRPFMTSANKFINTHSLLIDSVNYDGLYIF